MLPVLLRRHVVIVPEDEAHPVLELDIDLDPRRRLHPPPQAQRDDDAANLGRLILHPNNFVWSELGFYLLVKQGFKHFLVRLLLSADR